MLLHIKNKHPAAEDGPQPKITSLLARGRKIDAPVWPDPHYYLNSGTCLAEVDTPSPKPVLHQELLLSAYE